MRILIHMILLLLSLSAFSVEFAITMDDPNTYSTPLFSSLERDQLILRHLQKKNIQAALFVCGKRINSKEGNELLARWDKGGHIIGNHTYSHKNYNNTQITYREYSKDIDRNEKLIKGLKNFNKLFRFPFLKSGDSKRKREMIREFLHKKQYKHGYVTIDASDWYISDRLIKKLQKDPHIELEGYKKFYLKHMWERAKYYNDLAQKILGRSPKHTMLIHHNLLSALFLPDLIKYFELKGWSLIDAKNAFSDPIFSLEPNILPSGEGIIWALANERGMSDLRYPVEDSIYEKKEMDSIGL